MRSPADIASEYERRAKAQSEVHSRMREVARVYDDKTILPLPELNAAERPAVPNLTQQGLDQHAMRIASVLPQLDYPSMRPGYKEHDARAERRRRATLGWWEKSRMSLLLRKRARHLLGYSASPVLIKPCSAYRSPKWHVRDPLTSFPNEWGEPDDLRPEDIIFSTTHSGAWIRARWPEAYQKLYKGESFGYEDEYTILEYYDADQMTMIALGRQPQDRDRGYGSRGPSIQTGQVVVLEHAPNRLGVTPVVMPKRVNLNGSKGQFDGILGMYQTEAMLMALSVHATFKGIFQETWVLDNPNERADIEQIPNPLTGQPGVVHGGSITKFPVDPQFQTNEAIDRLEYGQRTQASIPAEFGGYGGVNVRTGRRGAQVMGAAIDMPIQEHQEILALSMTEENRIAVGIDKAYFGGESKSFYVSWPNSKGKVEYTPTETFDTDENTVSYAYAGADENALMILTGQRVGMQTMSKERAMEIDPMVTDVEHEKDLITAEALDMAFLSKVQADAANPESPMSGGDLAKLKRLVLTDKMDIEQAWDKVQEDVQKRQAEMMEAQMAQQQAMMGGAGPEAGAMPGLEEGTIPPPEQSMPGGRNLGLLLGALRQPNMTLSAEREGGVSRGAPA